VLVRIAEPAACVATAIRELGHVPYPWSLRDGYRHTTAGRNCGATAETAEVDGATYAEGAATLQPCTYPSGIAVRHLTLTGFYVGRPVCGTPAESKGAGSLHAAYWNPDRDGRGFCSACMAATAAAWLRSDRERGRDSRRARGRPRRRDGACARGVGARHPDRDLPGRR